MSVQLLTSAFRGAALVYRVTPVDGDSDLESFFDGRCDELNESFDELMQSNGVRARIVVSAQYHSTDSDGEVRATIFHFPSSKAEDVEDFDDWMEVHVSII